MYNRLLAITNLYSKKITHNFESILFLFKQFLSERNFIYLSCVLVGISCSLAVIVLKSFAHNVLVFANYINGFLNFPFFNIILPIIGILLTVLVIRKVLNGELEKGSSKILFAYSFSKP